MVLLLAATDLPIPIAVAVIAGVVAIATSLVAFLLNRRGGDDTWTLGLIHETQVSQSAALATANAQLTRQDLQLAHQEDLIEDLREQVAAMRVELDEALRSHRECEDARNAQAEIILELRDRLGEGDHDG